MGQEAPTFVRRTEIGPNAPKKIKPCGRRIQEPEAKEWTGKCLVCGSEGSLGLSSVRCGHCGAFSPGFADIMALMAEHSGVEADGHACVCVLGTKQAPGDLLGAAKDFGASMVFPSKDEEWSRLRPSKFSPVFIMTRKPIGRRASGNHLPVQGYRVGWTGWQPLSLFRHPRMAFYIFGHAGTVPDGAKTVELPGFSLPAGEDLDFSDAISMVLGDRAKKIMGVPKKSGKFSKGKK